MYVGMFTVVVGGLFVMGEKSGQRLAGWSMWVFIYILRIATVLVMVEDGIKHLLNTSL